MPNAEPKIVALQPKVAAPPPEAAPPPPTPAAASPSTPAAPAPKATWMRHRWRIVTASVVAVLLLAWALRNVVLGTPVPTFPVHTGNLTQTVVASGRVITPERVVIASQVVGRVERVAVDEGSKVLDGQLLIVLDSQDARAARNETEARVAMALAQLQSLGQVELPAALRSAEEAQSNFIQLRKQFDRLVELKASGFIGQADLDKAQRDRDVAQSQLQSAQLQVQTREPDGSNAAMARATLAQAQATRAQAVAKLALFQIMSPASGVLMSRAIESGDIVQPGQELMVLASSGPIRIEVQLDEKNLGKLALGQAALASADAYPNERFAATLSYINPSVDVSRGAVMVRLDIRTPPAYLRQDMTVSVDIETAARSAVLVLPTGAVHDLEGESPWVLVVRERQAVRQDIRLGLIGDNNTQVLSGLKDGEQVIPVSAATVLEGAHVRAQPQEVPAK